MSRKRTPKPPTEVDDEQLPPLRTCQGCGAKERRSLGYSTIAFHLGYCVDCITRAAGGAK